MTAESNRAVRSPDAAPSLSRRDGAASASRPRAGDPERDRQRAWLDVDLGALRRNAALVQARAGVPLLPMVKADAYGLGAVAVARALEALEPWGYGVAAAAEGEELRAAGIARPIVVFTPLLVSELPRARAAGLTPSLHRADDVARWAALGGGAWHLAIDTGMNRAGVRWDEVDALRAAVAAHPPEGVYTHFHSADLADDSRAEQERRFEAALGRLPAPPPLVHADNSPALERRSPSRWSVGRPGIFLYGVGSGSGVEPEPVVHLRARVVDRRVVRAGEGVSYGATWRAPADRVVATLAVGYADGYRRSLGNHGVVLVNGHEAPVVGWVTMDMTMIDVTGVPCEVGDVATLIGREPAPAEAGGDRTLDVAAVARAAGLSPYEILAGLRLRVPRLWTGG
jgi:alanine racemase